ncbi:MAG: response regulator [Elusimicrobia bacterium]|nr:response regulator [Candidatus Liberimonas magnetica]
MPETILIVDDEKEFREELKCSLEEYNVLEAPDGQEALKILSRPNEVDLVILDVRMPGLSGTEILKIIKKRESGIKVIMLTAYSSKDIAVDSLRGQANDYLEKPVDIDKLKYSIENLLEAKKNANKLDIPDVKEKIERIKRYIERNCFKKVSLEDAAKTVGLSPKYLSRVFNNVAGLGFMDYKLKVKIDRAKEILVSTGCTINQLSDKLGFMNPESFMRIFKKVTGLTPTKYRKKAIKAEKAAKKTKKTKKSKR